MDTSTDADNGVGAVAAADSRDENVISHSVLALCILIQIFVL